MSLVIEQIVFCFFWKGGGARGEGGVAENPVCELPGQCVLFWLCLFMSVFSAHFISCSVAFMLLSIVDQISIYQDSFILIIFMLF